MENWDPMKDEYRCSGNSARNPRNEHTLYVANIPMNVNRVGLQNMFEKYGKVLDLFLKVAAKSGRQYQFGILSYATFREANSAICGLNDAPPMKLKISFWKPKYDGSKISDNVDSTYDGSGAMTAYNDSETRDVQDATDNPGSKDYGHPSQSKVDNEALKVHVDPDYVRTLLTSNAQPSKQVTLSHRFSDTGDLSNDDESSNMLLCATCSAATTKGCTRCWTPYCSVSCQNQDWSRHKNDCAQLASKFEHFVLQETSQKSKPCMPNVVTHNGRNANQPVTPNSQVFKENLTTRNEVVSATSDQITANSSIVLKPQATPQPKTASGACPINESQKEERASSSASSAFSSNNASRAEIATWAKEAFPSGARVKVQIAHVNSPCSFYIRQEDQTKLMEIIAEMQEVKQDGPAVFKDAGFKHGFVVAAQYSEDGVTLWYRARVEKILPNSTAEILFVDFGNKETVESSSLRAVPKHLEGVHDTTVHCRLLGFPESDVYPDVILQKFRKICCGEMWVTNVGQEADKLVVRMDNSSTAGPCFNDVLRQDLERILPLRMKSLLEFCADSSLLSLTIVTASNNNAFWALGHTENVADTFFLLEQCGNEITDRNPRDWKVSDYVLAMSCEHSTWYRAQIVEILPSGFKVQFLDFGNVETVKEIVPLQGRCKDLPCLAILCSPCIKNMKDGDIVNGVFKTINGQAQLALTSSPAITLNLYAFNDPYAQRLLQNDLDVASSVKSSQVESSSARPKGTASQPTANIDEPLRSEVDVTKEGTATDQASYYEELKELEYKRFPKMSKIDVLSAESSSSIYVHAIDEVKDILNSLQDKLNTFLDENQWALRPPHELKLGNLVCAKFKEDQRWYRSVIESIVGEVITVRYVDYGNVESVSRDRIVALPRQFLSYPKAGIHVAIAGAPKDLAKFFEIKGKLFTPANYPLWMEIVDYRARPLLVKVFTNKSIDVMESEPRVPALSVGNVTGPYVLHNPYVEGKVDATPAPKRPPSQSSSVSSKSADAITQTTQTISSMENCKSTSVSRSTTANSIAPTPSATPCRESNGPASEDGVKSPLAVVDTVSPKPPLTAQCPEPKTYNLENSKTHCLPVGEELKLTVVHVTSPEILFFWQPEKQAANLSALNNEIQKYCCKLKHSPDFNPKFGDLCLAQFSVTKKWYRGAVMVYGMKESQVLFVDYGNIEFVQNSLMAPIIDQFTELPLQAVHCRIDGCYTDRDWSESVLGKLIEADDTFLVKVVSFDDITCSYSIQIPSLTKQLKGMNILPSD